VRPGIAAFSWSHSNNNPAFLSSVARRLATGLPEGPVVVAGHSAGAASGAWIAAEMRDLGVDVRRLVMIDGVENPTGLIRRCWPRLSEIQIRALLAPPSRCNREGRLGEWLAEQSGDIECVLIPDSGHGDIEGGSESIYRWACGDDSSAATRRLVMDTAVQWVKEGLTLPR
jgi:hypothetical protein